jgi:RHS repeat-associated protein
VVAVFDGSNNWMQSFAYNALVDGVEMLEQADVLDHDNDGNTTEITRTYYHAQALGSVVEVTDANQNTIVSYRYDPYGGLTITRGGAPQSTDPLNQHWAFTGRYYDEETGLYYFRARYYSPSLGRFVQRDPLGYAMGPNLFEYAHSAPTNFVDPTGLGEKKETPPRPYDATGITMGETEPPQGDTTGWHLVQQAHRAWRRAHDMVSHYNDLQREHPIEAGDVAAVVLTAALAPELLLFTVVIVCVNAGAEELGKTIAGKRADEALKEMWGCYDRLAEYYDDSGWERDRSTDEARRKHKSK